MRDDESSHDHDDGDKYYERLKFGLTEFNLNYIFGLKDFEIF